MPERINAQAFRVRTGQQTDILNGMLVHRARYGGSRDFIDPALDERRPVLPQINPGLFLALSQTEAPALLESPDYYRRIAKFSLDVDFDKNLARANVTRPVEAYAPAAAPLGNFALVSIIDRSPAAIEQGHPDIIENDDAQIIQTIALGDTACGVAVCLMLVPEHEEIVFKSDKEYKLKFNPRVGLTLENNKLKVGTA